MVGRLILGLALLLPLSCQAQVPTRSAAAGLVAPWTKVPAVVVVGASANNARLPLVQEAVAFWNRSLGKALVAIKSDQFWPLSLPNVPAT